MKQYDDESFKRFHNISNLTGYHQVHEYQGYSYNGPENDLHYNKCRLLCLILLLKWLYLRILLSDYYE